MSMRVSVAMATFNGMRYLDAQLQSIAAQTCPPWELVIFDDGSTDQTVPMAHEFARTVPFQVRIFSGRERVGYRKNFMRAAQECSGELIAFCDQDDIWAPEKLEHVCHAFGNPDVLLAFHNARLIDTNGTLKGSVFKANQEGKVYAPLEMQPWTIVPGLTQVMRRSLLKFSDFHDRSIDLFSAADCMPHDQWFLFLASVFGHTEYVSEDLVHYHQHDANTSGWLRARRFAFVAHSVSHAHYYARTALASVDSRIELLTHMLDAVRGDDVSRVQAALDYYQHVRAHAERRLSLYSSKSLRKRARSLLSLIKHGAYTHPRVRWGLDNLLLDVCVGLPAGPKLRAS